MAIDKHLFLATFAGLWLGLCVTPAPAGDSGARAPLKPETAQQRAQADAVGRKIDGIMRNNHAAQAMRMIDQAVYQNPQSASIYAWRARLKIELSFDLIHCADEKAEIRDIERDVARAMALDNTVSNAYYVSGRLAILETNEQKALAALDKAVQYDDKNLSAHMWRAYVLEGENRAKEALHDLDAAVKIQESQHTLTKRALLRRHLGDFKGAVADYTKAYKIAPQTFVLIKRGEVYEEANQFDKAIADFQQVLQSTTDKVIKVSCHKKMARMYYALSRYADAQKELSAVLALNEDDFPSISKHMSCALKLKQWDVALKDVNKLLEFENEYAGYYRQRAEIYRAMGRPSLAAADEKKAQELQAKSLAPIR